MCHCAIVLRVNRLNSIQPWSDVKRARFAQIEKHKAGVVKECEDPQCTVDTRQPEIGTRYPARGARIRSSPCSSEVSAIVFRNTRAATGCRSEW